MHQYPADGRRFAQFDKAADGTGRMRAIRYHEAGGPEVLRPDDVEKPTPGPDDVLVEIRAASVNPVDAKYRQRGSGPTPKTTGSDFAGVVEAVGGGITEFSPGDRVCGTGLHTARFQQGSFAEYVAAPSDVVSHLPDSVSFEDGAAVALVGVTAWRGLVDHAGLQPADACLVHGGTGGVGHIAVQLANRLQARVVATAATDKRHAAEAFGADAVVAYDREDLLEALSEHADRGFDVIFDHRAEEYLPLDLDAAAFGGRIVCYSGVEGDVELSRNALVNELTVQAMTMSNLTIRPELPSVAHVLDRVLDLTDRGRLSPEITRVYDLTEAAAAHRAVLEDSFVGKLVVVP